MLIFNLVLFNSLRFHKLPRTNSFSSIIDNILVNSISNISVYLTVLCAPKICTLLFRIDIIASMKKEKKVIEGTAENGCVSLAETEMDSSDYNNPFDTTNTLILPAKTKVSRIFVLKITKLT